ncbi:MAG: class I SAM-dependent methyltransferase [Deltaproteobacteria bacterium]|nr:class I SAM-dependent methyltransferase [Deltaproteobacteria bacterium]
MKLIIGKFNLAPDNILDFACGTGLLISFMSESSFANVEGVDNSSEMLRSAKDKGLRVFHGNMQTLSLNRKYDLIVAFDALGHITTSED